MAAKKATDGQLQNYVQQQIKFYQLPGGGLLTILFQKTTYIHPLEVQSSFLKQINLLRAMHSSSRRMRGTRQLWSKRASAERPGIWFFPIPAVPSHKSIMNVLGYIYGGLSSVLWVEYFQYVVYLTLRYHYGFKTAYELVYLSWKEQSWLWTMNKCFLPHWENRSTHFLQTHLPPTCLCLQLLCLSSRWCG